MVHLVHLLLPLAVLVVTSTSVPAATTVQVLRDELSAQDTAPLTLNEGAGVKPNDVWTDHRWWNGGSSTDDVSTDSDCSSHSGSHGSTNDDISSQYPSSSSVTYPSMYPSSTPVIYPSALPTPTPVTFPFKFTSDITISGLNTYYLDGVAQNAIATAANIVMNYVPTDVTFVSSSIQYRRKSLRGRRQLQSYTVVVTIETSAEDTDDDSDVYNTLVTNLENAVADGTYLAELIKLIPSLFFFATIDGVTNSAPEQSSSEEGESSEQNGISGIVVVIIIITILLTICACCCCLCWRSSCKTMPCTETAASSSGVQITVLPPNHNGDNGGQGSIEVSQVVIDQRSKSAEKTTTPSAPMQRRAYPAPAPIAMPSQSPPPPNPAHNNRTTVVAQPVMSNTTLVLAPISVQGVPINVNRQQRGVVAATVAQTSL